MIVLTFQMIDQNTNISDYLTGILKSIIMLKLKLVFSHKALSE